MNKLELIKKEMIETNDLSKQMKIKGIVFDIWYKGNEKTYELEFEEPIQVKTSGYGKDFISLSFYHNVNPILGNEVERLVKEKGWSKLKRAIITNGKVYERNIL